MQKFSLGFLRAPQGPHWPKTSCYGEGAPLWRVKCEGRKKTVWKSKFLRNSFLQTQIHKHSQRKQGGKGGEALGRMAGWGEGGAGWGSIPFTYIPISGGGSLHLPRVATLSPSHTSLTGYFFEAFGSVDQPEKFFGPQGSSWIFGIFRLSHWRHSWVPLKGSLREDSCFFLSGSGLSLRPHSLMGHSVGALRNCIALQRKYLS